MSANAVLAAKFVKGTTAASPATPIFTFAATPTVPTDVFVRATDTDGVTSSAKAHEGGVKVVSGRIKVSNAYGSELLKLPITVTAQYWDGTSLTCCYVKSATDSISPFTTSNVAFSNWVPSSTTSTWTTGATSVVTPPTSVVFTKGVAGFVLSKPGVNVTGWVDMMLNAPSYFLGGSNVAGDNPSISGRATFGIYKGNSNFIYMRESY
jgi:MSHA biogenesis protein MshQ